MTATTRCPKCSYISSRGAKYCFADGTQMRYTEDRKCLECGYPPGPLDTYCEECGTKLNSPD